MNHIKHIHEVIFLIEKNDAQWSPEELTENIGNTWGKDILFGSCSGNAFAKEYALDFLLSREKVCLNDQGKVALHPQMKICKGHESF